MFDRQAVKQAFGRAAVNYDEHAQLQHVVREECITMAQLCWGEGDHILDVGCGTGAFVSDIEKRGIDWQVHGLDVSPGMCAIAREHGVSVVSASADAIPFADALFDGVFSCLMLQWSDEPLKVLREMHRVLAPGGCALIATFTHGTLEELRESFATLDAEQHVNHFIDSHALSAFAVHAGFTLLAGEEETFTAHYPNTLNLMRSLKAIGATTKTSQARKGMMTPGQLKKLEDAYRTRYGDKEGLPATWQVMYMILEKIG